MACLVQAPGQIYILGEGSARPAVVRPEDVGPIHRATARGDERLPVVLLQLLVVGEREQILDVAPPLPHAPHTLRKYETTRRRDGRMVERRQQALEGVRCENRIGVDG